MLHASDRAFSDLLGKLDTDALAKAKRLRMRARTNWKTYKGGDKTKVTLKAKAGFTAKVWRLVFLGPDGSEITREYGTRADLNSALRGMISLGFSPERISRVTARDYALE